MRGLQPIGAFARASGLTIKALRHYDAHGLLRPAFVDPATRRRYYSGSQLAEARLIARLRALDLPLDEVAALLAARDAPAVRSRLDGHRERLQEEIDRRAAAVTALDALLEQDAAAERAAVEVRQRPATDLLVAGVRTTQPELAAAFGGAFPRVLRRLAELGEVPAGPPLTRYVHRGAFLPHDVRAEVGVPVARPLPGAGGVLPRRLEPVRVATTVHAGPYAELDAAYARLQDGVVRLGLRPAGPPIETYLVGPDRASGPAGLRTELAQPVA
jgi:DNA-binding transcriptional MerR regulator